MSDRITLLSDVIGDEIARYRKRAGLTREEFAAECWEAGAPSNFTATVVGTIENGRRKKDSGARTRVVSVDELAFIAKAMRSTVAEVLGEHAAAFGAEPTERPECPQCAAETGRVLRATRDDVEALGELQALAGVEHAIAETAYALAFAIDAGGGEDGSKLPQLAKELRATLKVLVDARNPKAPPSEEEDDLGFGGPQ